MRTTPPYYCSLDTQFNGHHLNKVPAKDKKAHGRALLDILFTKEEQSQGLVISNNSGRPVLDEERTHLLLGKSAYWLFDCMLVHAECEEEN